MNKRLVLTTLSVFLLFCSFAQNLTVSGRLQDAESRQPLQGATVVLRSIRDTTLSSTSYTDTSGRFQFDQLARDSFQLIATSVGYETLTRSVKVDSADVVLGPLALPRTSKELSGVTVTARVPPATQKGDTVQYNAGQFKVNPDATVEDLARKMPGITVENGQVKAHGEDVKKVTIDGRELFGDDATAALRNLPAEIVDKIQVFDRLSDQSQFTGFDDGNSTKSINIITKAGMRNGQFGRVYGGYGTNDRYQAGGNTTILKGNQRISLVGNFNNTNQQNFAQQDLLGVTSNAQRGGGGGGPRGGGGGQRGGNQGNRGGGGNGGGFGSSANFLVGQQDGINRTNAAGINYSDLWGKKLTVTGSYFFNNTGNTTNEISSRQYFLNTIPAYADTTASSSNNNNHRINMRLEYRIDSSNQLIITPNLSFQNNSTNRMVSTSSFFEPGHAINSTSNNVQSHTNGYNLNNSILYRHSFAKRGRTFSINLNTSANQRNGLSTTQYQATTASGDSSQQRSTDRLNNGYQLSANLVYTEPVGQKAQLQLNYNPTYSKSKGDQRAYLYDETNEKYSLFDSTLSNKLNTDYNAQNAGLAYRYGSRDNQFSVGVNYQHARLNSDQFFPRPNTVDKSFDNVLPNAMLRFKLSPRSNVRLMYRASTNQPSVTQLQNVYDVTNLPFVTGGNPNLNQQYTNVLSTRYTYTNTGSGVLLVANVFLQQANNYITNATFVPTKDSAIGGKIVLQPGQQLTVPVNLNGYTSLRSFLTFAVPLRPLKSNFNLNGGVTYAHLPGIINNVESRSTNTTYTLGSVLASNISQYVDFTLSYSANFNQVSNAVQQSLNNNYFTHVARAQLNLLNKQGWFFQNDVNNQLYSGLAAGYNQSYWLWNMSAGKKILKDQKGELRLSVFDLLGQNRSISRDITETYIEDTRNTVLQRYFMLTFTYNLRNFGAVASNGAGGGNRGGRGAGMRY